MDHKQFCMLSKRIRRHTISHFDRYCGLTLTGHTEGKELTSLQRPNSKILKGGSFLFHSVQPDIAGRKPCSNNKYDETNSPEQGIYLLKQGCHVAHPHTHTHTHGGLGGFDMGCWWGLHCHIQRSPSNAFELFFLMGT